MSITVQDTFRDFSVKLMQRSEATIDKCLDRLTPEQILHRNGDHENSIANLLMHIEGNLRQWFLHGIDCQPDIRTRDAEFSLQALPEIPEIRARFAQTLAKCRSVVAGVSDERLLEVIDPQPGGGWEPTPILAAIYRVIGHLEHHTGQIILLTKQLTRTDLDLTLPRKR